MTSQNGDNKRCAIPPSELLPNRTQFLPLAVIVTFSEPLGPMELLFEI